MSSHRLSSAELPVSYGPYVLSHRLGVGGMAETYVAIRRAEAGFEQRVCLKRILETFEEDATFEKMFLDEARMSASLRHPNIAQVLDFGDVDGSLYLTLELIEGTDLRGVLHHCFSELTTGLVSYIAFEIASALEFAHQQGIVHRDVSPSNVLVSNVGEIKLADFGIARAVSKLTRSDGIKGKVQYMAPEYARTGNYLPTSDLFSLGVVLYECICGHRPFDGPNAPATLRNAARGTFKKVLSVVPNANTELAGIVETLISPDPALRFSDATALLLALEHIEAPPTAEKILGRLVTPLTPSASSPPEATQDVAGSLAPSTPHVRPASAEAATHTRIKADGPTLLANIPSSGEEEPVAPGSVPTLIQPENLSPPLAPSPRPQPSVPAPVRAHSLPSQTKTHPSNAALLAIGAGVGLVIAGIAAIAYLLLS